MRSFKVGKIYLCLNYLPPTSGFSQNFIKTKLNQNWTKQMTTACGYFRFSSLVVLSRRGSWLVFVFLIVGWRMLSCHCA